jgi:hypothetical protein
VTEIDRYRYQLPLNEGKAIGLFSGMNDTLTLKALVKQQLDLELELQKTRHDSLIAARRGDYRRVAQLTVQASRLNQQLTDRKVQQEIAT